MDTCKKLSSFIILLSLAVSISSQYQGSYHGYHGNYHGGHGALGGQYGHGYGEHKDFYAPPHYTYEYNVHDPHTGDIKKQQETREGDVVKGYYALKEADGSVREVHYSADKHNGFNAEVKRSGHGIHHYGPRRHY